MSKIMYGVGIAHNRRLVYRFGLFPQSAGDAEVWYVLDHYTVESRPSARHKWRITHRYDRLDKRNSTVALEDVPITAEVLNYVHGEAVKRIAVGIKHESDSYPRLVKTATAVLDLTPPGAEPKPVDVATGKRPEQRFLLRYGDQHGSEFAYVCWDTVRKDAPYGSHHKSAVIAECQRRNGFEPVDGDEQTYAKQSKHAAGVPVGDRA